MSPSSHFTPEGGKYHLAESLFSQHRFQIRCPSCPGIVGAPGFIKDQAGKSPKDGLNRRMWKCQRSNSKTTTVPCPRKTCTEYINLARQTLPADRFRQVVTDVEQHPDRPAAERELLASYHSLLSSPSSRKRKALAELNNPRTRLPPPTPTGLAVPTIPLGPATPPETDPSPPELPGRAITLVQQAIRQTEAQLEAWRAFLPPASDKQPDPNPSSSLALLVPSSPPPPPEQATPPTELARLVHHFQHAQTTVKRSQIRQRVKALGIKKSFEAQLTHDRKATQGNPKSRYLPLPFTPATPNPDPIQETSPASSA